MNKDMRELVREVEGEGWVVSRRRNGHLLMKGPEGQKVFCSSTPSDGRAISNIKRDLAANGLDIR